MMRYGEPEPQAAPAGENQKQGLRPRRTRTNSLNRREPALFNRRQQQLNPSPFPPSVGLAHRAVQVGDQLVQGPALGSASNPLPRHVHQGLQVLPGRPGRRNLRKSIASFPFAVTPSGAGLGRRRSVSSGTTCPSEWFAGFGAPCSSWGREAGSACVPCEVRSEPRP